MIRISTREAQRAQVYLTQPNVQPIPEPIPMASAGGDTTILGQGVWEVLTKGVGGTVGRMVGGSGRTGVDVNKMESEIHQLFRSKNVIKSRRNPNIIFRYRPATKSGFLAITSDNPK